MKRLTETNSIKASNMLKDLIEEIQNKEKELGIKLLTTYGIVKETVGLYKSIRSFGNCNKKPLFNSGECLFTISLNENLIKKGNDYDIKSVLIHELIHTVKGCFNHQNKFKSQARLLQKYLGYNALKKDFDKEILNRPNRKDRIKYVLVCKNCGQQIWREKKTRFVEYPEIYTCGICGGHFERLK